MREEIIHSTPLGRHPGRRMQVGTEPHSMSVTLQFRVEVAAVCATPGQITTCLILTVHGCYWKLAQSWTSSPVTASGASSHCLSEVKVDLPVACCWTNTNCHITMQRLQAGLSLPQSSSSLIALTRAIMFQPAHHEIRKDGGAKQHHQDSNTLLPQCRGHNVTCSIHSMCVSCRHTLRACHSAAQEGRCQPMSAQPPTWPPPLECAVSPATATDRSRLLPV